MRDSTFYTTKNQKLKIRCAVSKGTNMAKKLIVVGVDGGDFNIIKPWANEGKLPAFKKLMEDGTHGFLKSTYPPVTSPAWPSFMTGKNPAKHGVFGFVQGSKNFKLYNREDIDSKCMWD